MTGTCKTIGSKSWARLGVALFAVLGLAGAAAAQGAATLTSDAGDYPPGATATLTGAGFGAGDTVTLLVVHADGSPSTGAEHTPWEVVADANGGFVTTWHVCEDDCVGQTLLATADGLPSGEHADTTFTDAVPGSLICVSGCVGNTPTHYNVLVPGGCVSARIDGATDLGTATTAPNTINIIIKSSALGNTIVVGTKNTGNGAPQPSYEFTYCPPSNLCNTTIVAYDTNGNNSNNDYLDDGVKNGSSGAAAGFRAVDSSGQSIQCGGGCVCSGEPTISGCVAGTSDLGCNPTSIPGCDPTVAASDNCGSVPVNCLSADSGPDCARLRTLTYTATNTCGTTTCVRTYTWKVDITAPVLANVPAGGNLGCNPTPPTCDSTVTATGNGSGTGKV